MTPREVVTVTRARTMACAPEHVWAALADFGAISAWAPAVDHSCLLRATGDGDGVGSVRRIQMGRTTLLERVVTWDEPETLAYEIEGLPPVVRSARNQWRLQPAGGGTVVTLTSSVDCGPRPPQRLVARIVARRMASESASMLAGLSHLLEEARSHA